LNANAAVHPAVSAIRLADLRFVSTALVRRAALVGSLPHWREGLERAGINIGEEPPQLVVAADGQAREAARQGAETIVVEGSGGRRALASAGYTARGFLVRPHLEDPSLVIALEHRAAARYAVTHATGSRSGWRNVRNSIGAELLGRGLLPLRASSVLVGSKRDGSPAMVAAAAGLGVPSESEWFLVLGRGDQLSRNAFFLFEPGSADPTWVLKFVRVPGYREPFERDERGLTLASREPLAAAHAPGFLGRFAVEGLEASVETAAVGELLKRLLESGLPRADGLRQIESVAAWLVELAGATRAAPAALEPERVRVAREVIPAWAELGATAALVESLPPVPSVLQHNDLGSWNVVVGRTSFTALDWEWSRTHGFPLWDLVYFLTDSLATLGGVGEESWETFVVRLYRGELENSGVLFKWIRKGVEASGVPAEAVGPILTLGWMHHGLTHVARSAALARAGALGYPSPPLLERVARTWLAAPELGSGWRRWQEG